MEGMEVEEEEEETYSSIQSGTCIICCSYYECKPQIGGSGGCGGGAGGQVSEFKRAFRLFQKLLLNGGNGVGGGGGDLVSSKPPPPCCVECREGILSILKLQNLIEESQASQLEHMDTLKGSLLFNNFNYGPERMIQKNEDDGTDEFWLITRNQLIECLTRDRLSLESNEEVIQQLHNKNEEEHALVDEDDELPSEKGYSDLGHLLANYNNSPEVAQIEKSASTSTSSFGVLKRKRGRPKKVPGGTTRSNEDNDIIGGGGHQGLLASTKIIIRPCSVVLERILEPSIIPEDSSSGGRSSSSRRPARKSKQRAYHNLSRSVKLLSSRKEEEVEESSDRDMEWEGSWSDHDEFTPPVNENEEEESSSTPSDRDAASESDDSTSSAKKSKKNPAGPRPRRGRRRVPDKLEDTKQGQRRRLKWFYNLGSNLLLYRHTPIKYSPRGFTCLDCSEFFVEGIDYASFQQIKSHIIKVHMEMSWGTTKKNFAQNRPCPLCPRSCGGGASLRSHLMKDHLHTSKMRDAVCPSCWKPQPVAELRAHVWTHKSVEEVEEAVQAGYVNPLLEPQLLLPSVIKRKAGGYREAKRRKRAREKEERRRRARELEEQNRIVKQEEGLLVVYPRRARRPNLLSSDPTVNNKAEPKKKQASGSGDQRRGPSKSSPTNSIFYYLNENFILLRHTPIQMSSTGFRCLEPGCRTADEEFRHGTDYGAFEQIKEHILKSHVKEGYASTTRPCPLCQQRFPSGPDLRRHIGREHFSSSKLPMVICPCCRKPAMSLAALPAHAWSHKSKEEKVAALAAGYVDPTVDPSSRRPPPKKNSSPPIAEQFSSSDDRKAAVQGIHRQQPHQIVNQEGLVVYPRRPRRRRPPNYSGPTKKANKTKIEAKPTAKPSKRKASGATRSPHSSIVYYLSDKFLLIRHTPIGMTPTGLKCLEPECNAEFQGTDYSAFEQIKEHIPAAHVRDGYVSIPRLCPLCQQSFRSGPKLRQHIARDHFSSSKLPMVICPSCAKPLSLAALPAHVWRHKSEEEKAEALAAGYVDPTVDPASRPPKTKIQEDDSSSPDDDFVVVVEEACTNDNQEGPNQTSAEGRGASQGAPEEDWRHLYREAKHERDMFLSMSSDLLLFNLTPVRLSSQRFSCLETDCGHFVEGTDYLSFQRLREHIRNRHETQTDYQSKSRPCPICAVPEVGLQFRSHLCQHFSLGHKPDAICPCCWAPVRWNAFYAHLWTHKSEEEQAAARAAGEGPRPIKPPKKRESTTAAAPLRPPDQDPLEVFQCENCGKNFTTYRLLYAHRITHRPKELRKKYPCSYCSLELLSDRARIAHIERLHRPDLMVRPPLACPICDKKFHYLSGEAYRTHVRGHKGERPFVCHMCGSGFFSNSALKSHFESVHSTDKYQCEYCAATFKCVKSLRRHGRAAHGDKVPGLSPDQAKKFISVDKRPGFIGPKLAHPCESCGKVFQLRSRLTKHVKVAHHHHVKQNDDDDGADWKL